MQTSKFLFAMGAAVAVILPLQVQAGPDNEEQAKMRAALRQKMEELNTSKTGTPVAPPVEPAPAPPPAPAVTAAPAAKPQPAPVAPPPAVVAAPQTQVVPVAPVKVEVPEQPAQPTAPPVDDATEELMRAALRQKIAELKTAPAAPATAAKPVVAPPVSPGATPVVAPAAAKSYTAIVPPQSPLTGTKEARLAELLARYKADTITALEYHTQRAAILAEP